MKYSSIILNNEIWLVEARIRYDLEWFDKIIIAESNTTFSGLQKPFFFEKYQYLFKEFKDRIVYKKITDLPKPITGEYIGTMNRPSNENRWICEHAMRDRLKEAILSISDDQDIICFQDSDEIVSHEFLESLELENIQDSIIKTRHYDFRQTLLQPHKPTSTHGFITAAKNLKLIDAHDYSPVLTYKRGAYFAHHIVSPGVLRHKDGTSIYKEYKLPIQNIIHQSNENLGWHLSDMYGGKELKELTDIQKIKGNVFAHSEYEDKNFDLSPPYFEQKTEKIIEWALNKPIDKSIKLAPNAPEFIFDSIFFNIFCGLNR